ncbi:MAG: hypothetical protein GY868_15335, partial [Deltaproteobacteria bacterium]|nr:hypothetical protein [Deltaproteobacteria bacterium]
CCITAGLIHGEVQTGAVLLGVTAGTLCSHFLLDFIPHGFIATPKTIFKKTVPTLIEIIPGPVILLAAILLFGHPELFFIAAVFSCLPDVVAVVYNRDAALTQKIPGARALHRLHRFIHWFETDHADGSTSFLFPNRPLLAVEVVVILGMLVVLFGRKMIIL